MTGGQYPPDFLERLKAVTNKRPRTVIEHILQHGHITTEELKTLYGYDHPPRAARDVREQGIPLETFKVKNAGGRTIAAYRFAPLETARADKLGGREPLPKRLKDELVATTGSRCQICLRQYSPTYLQLDHRVPYEVAGELTEERRTAEHCMLLCNSCNRAKSWSCEHCPNWLEEKSVDICAACYWAQPESYKHIGLRAIRRLDLVWTEGEVEAYDRLLARAMRLGKAMPDYVKAVLDKHLRRGR